MCKPKTTHTEFIMSLSSRKSPLAVRIRASITLQEALFEEGYEYVAGRLEDLMFDPGQCSQEDADYIYANRQTLTKEQMQVITCSKSRGAKYIAYRIFDGAEPDLKKLASDWAAHKELKSWMLSQDFEWLKKMDLVSSSWNREEGHEVSCYYPGRLIGLGIRFAWQAERFCRLYAETCSQKRSWRSCYQTNKDLTLEVALTPNYNRLPVWAKRVLIETGNVPNAERIGNIWDLIPAAKAWKYHQNFPKSIAKRVGEMPVWKRMVAAKAWKKVSKGGYSLNYFRQYQDGWEYSTTRTSLTNEFWIEFDKMSAYNPVALLDDLATVTSDRNQKFVSHRAEAILGLPHKYLNGRFQSDNLIQYYAMADQDALLIGLFGTNAKSVKAAWTGCNLDQIKWAIELAPKGNADVVCKFLSAPCVVVFQKDTVPFLQSLGDWKPQLRMIETTTYRVRGEEKIVEDFLVKDTGMLFSNLAQQRGDNNLGRVRCWLSAHEELGRRYIGTLPNSPVSIPSNWERVNGLCAIDGTWRIELPTSTAQLKYWGEQLHNCVGGYGNSINSGDCIVFVVYVNSMLTYCVEVRSGSIRQFNADRNSSTYNEVRDSVTAALQQAKLLN
jgi:hypothetical protein